MILFVGVAFSACIDTCTTCQDNFCQACISGYYPSDGSCYKTGRLSSFAIVCIIIGGIFVLFGIITIIVSIIRANRRRNVSQNINGRR
jgi:hypothetical protein